jgi:starch synthase
LLADLARRHAGKFWAYLGFDDELAHRIEAGADIFLMPSLFEPCGLNQLYSLSHGTVPVVRATGGLADTVVDANAETLARGTATGFVFNDPTPQALWETIQRVLALWPDRKTWLKLMKTAMQVDWSWERSALEYSRLYEDTRAKARARYALAHPSELSSRSPGMAGSA